MVISRLPQSAIENRKSAIFSFARFSKFHCWPTARGPAVSTLGTLRSLANTTRFQLLSTAAIFVDTNRDVTQHAIVDAHAAFELGNLAARAFDLEQHKRTVF